MAVIADDWNTVRAADVAVVTIYGDSDLKHSGPRYGLET